MWRKWDRYPAEKKAKSKSKTWRRGGGGGEGEIWVAEGEEREEMRRRLDVQFRRLSSSPLASNLAQVSVCCVCVRVCACVCVCVRVRMCMFLFVSFGSHGCVRESHINSSLPERSVCYHSHLQISEVKVGEEERKKKKYKTKGMRVVWSVNGTRKVAIRNEFRQKDVKRSERVSTKRREKKYRE